MMKTLPRTWFSLSWGKKNTNFPLLAIWTSLFFSPSLSLSLMIGVWILIIKVLRHNLRDNLLKITVNKMNIKFLMNSFLILYLGFIFFVYVFIYSMCKLRIEIYFMSHLRVLGFFRGPLGFRVGGFGVGGLGV